MAGLCQIIGSGDADDAAAENEDFHRWPSLFIAGALGRAGG
jgi:hypothetical protein